VNSADFSSGSPTAVPVNEVISEAINEVIFDAIRRAPGINKPKIILLAGKSRATVERAIAKLIAEERVIHRGSKKTGGYYVVKEETRDESEGREGDEA